VGDTGLRLALAGLFILGGLFQLRRYRERQECEGFASTQERAIFLVTAAVGFALAALMAFAALRDW
jgi:hypothetical protein